MVYACIRIHPFVSGGWFPFISIKITLIDACIEAYPSFVTILESDPWWIRGSFLKTALARAAPFGTAAVGMIAVLSLTAPFLPSENRTIMYLLLILISMTAVTAPMGMWILAGAAVLLAVVFVLDRVRKGEVGKREAGTSKCAGS